VRFFARDHEALLDAARERLSAFLGTHAEALAFVPNATAGFNAVLRSLPWRAGDEILITDHAYNALITAAQFVAGRTGVRVVVAQVPFPTASPEVVLESVLARVTPATRLAVIDHVTSPTGMVWPAERLVRLLADRGVDTLVDGAHAPGMLDLNLDALGAAYYTGNCHKWICAPKGAAFLVVRADRRDAVRPLAISHGANSKRADRSRFHLEFDWTGTHDTTPYLCVPAAIEFMGGLLRGGWPALRAQNHALACAGRRLLAEALGVEPPCPASMLGSLAALPLPDGDPTPPVSSLYADPLQKDLLEAAGVEVPVVSWPGPPKRLVRISAQVYNAKAEYERLADALRGRLSA
jgi:isopenicillin-N epimerase